MTNNTQRDNNVTSAKELFEMQTEVALVSSMFQSKTLTLMVIIGILSFSGFMYFLFNIAS